jgi:hypothetical protein
MLIEGGIVEDDRVMSDWTTREGTADLRVNWSRPGPVQRFTHWTGDGEAGLGEEDVATYSEEAVCGALKTNNPFPLPRPKY